MSGLSTCALCPRLCRWACPVAVGSSREAATPTAIAGALLDGRRSLLSPSAVADAVTLCVTCGACQDACHLHQPLPDLLREAQLAWAPPLPPDPPTIPEPGEGDLVVEADDRPLAAWWARRTGQRTRRWETLDGLGAAAIGSGHWEAHAEALRAAVGAVHVWAAHGDVAQALAAAGVAFSWLPAPPEAISSCRRDTGTPGPLACCGAAAPFSTRHPEDAARVARRYARDLPDGAVLADARCACHLRSSGVVVRDVVMTLGVEGS